MNRIVVVGGSTGAVRSVQALRRAGYDGELVLVSDEAHLPYDRPPLSKDLLAPESDGSPVPLLTAEDVERLDLDVRLGTRAVGLEPANRTLHVVDDEGPSAIVYDGLVVATGVQPRRLPGTDHIDGVHVIRTLEDARAVRDRLGEGRRAVVVGAGFIGAEFASVARARGVEVTLVEAQEVPLAHVLGREVAAEVASVHEAQGARLMAGRSVAEVVTDQGQVRAVRLDDGTELPADLVVVGIGATPATDWLVGSGLPVDDGVECDVDLQVVGHPGIYAVGDVARWPHPAYGRPLRIEHWTNAGDQAEVVAAHVVGRDRPNVPLPYVWSDQYGHRIQIVGRPADGVAVAVHGSVAGGDLAALYAGPDGRLVGAVVVDDPRLLMRLRKAATAGTPAGEVERALLTPAS
ncbi:NAD(P)/FAD-dependent oxidoreductase [Nocardioides sp. J54]|uniref:NAD(P)/FAD-dependent oxidoreductase n=1 Tax=Nocardioides sp. J54 TaxID=935866 RepID=UPI00048BE217|nr:FAD/NAD(P)-binding oxidoreductase [Nocardioides sp. J54]